MGPRLKYYYPFLWLHVTSLCILAFLHEPRRYEQLYVNSPDVIIRPPLTILSSSSYNPNDLETAEERAARMELVRKIQATFYREDPSQPQKLDNNNNNEDEDQDPTKYNQWSRFDDVDPSIIYNLPLWRVQWTELPGYQNVLNVHVPHYTHMFRTLLAQNGYLPISTTSSSSSSSSSVNPRRPVFFGHVFLPGGSEQLGNVEYNLPEEEEEDDDPESSSNNYNKATLIGTLMKITDVMEHPEDGRLTLVVQGVAPMRIVTANQQIPYAVASKVRILLDNEPLESIVQTIQKQLGDGEDGGGPIRLPTLRNAVRATMAKQADLLRPLEYWSTKLPLKSDLNSNGLVVSPLSNVNGSFVMDSLQLSQLCQDTFRAVLTCAPTSRTALNQDMVIDNQPTTQALFCPPSPMDDLALLAPIRQQEKEVWIQLDLMLRLLGKIQPELSIPVPSQLLGLLPTFTNDDDDDDEWPKDFRLEEYTDKLERFNTSVGTYSRSPFVRLSKAYPDYPSYRRASRLSYSVWLLLESINVGNHGFLDRQMLLEKRRIGDRLQLAIQQLQTVNDLLIQLIP